MQPPPSEQILFQGSDFADWASLNDTIMGGRSRAGCRVTPDGLVLEGDLVETGGGFVSCRSPACSPRSICRPIRHFGWMLRARDAH